QLEQQLAESQSKIAQMAAENSAVKVMNDCLSEELRGYQSDGAFDGPKMHLLWWKTEASATDAFMAEVRAQGVEMLNTQFKKCTGMLYADSVVTTAEHFAALLRKGVQS